MRYCLKSVIRDIVSLPYKNVSHKELQTWTSITQYSDRCERPAVGRPRFDALVESHESDKYCNGNRSISYHLGLDREIKRSSIS